MLYTTLADNLILSQCKSDAAAPQKLNRTGLAKCSGLPSNAEYWASAAMFTEHHPDGSILLTKEGQKKAAAVYDRHVTLTRYINEILGVDMEIAEKDACRIEHIISPETFAGIKAQLAKK